MQIPSLHHQLPFDKSLKSTHRVPKLNSSYHIVTDFTSQWINVSLFVYILVTNITTCNRIEITLELPSDDFQGIRRSAEFVESYNYLPSSITQPKNYLSIYSDTFSRILSDKNHPNFTLHQFRVFGYGPIPKNEITEFAVSLRKCHLLCQWWMVVTVHSLITWY